MLTVQLDGVIVGTLRRNPADLYTSVVTAKTKYNFRYEIKLTATMFLG